MRKLLSEMTGTFALVFCGTGAIVMDAASGGAVTHLGVALSFGLVVMVVIHTLGDVSGAHINPAVTLAFAVGGRFPFRNVLPYWAAQLTGALAASLLLRLLFPEHETLGATLPVGPPLRSAVLEFLLSFLLMLVIESVASGPKERGIFAGITIGATVGLEALFAGPICGASMNPARSLAPALLSGHTEYLWIYLLAPSLGMLAAVPVGRYLLHPQTKN